MSETRNWGGSRNNVGIDVRECTDRVPSGEELASPRPARWVYGVRGERTSSRSHQGESSLMLVETVISVALVSLAVAALVVVSAPLHARWTADVAGHGVQKHHHGSPPRVGLIPILVGCFVAGHLLVGGARDDGADELFGQLLICGLPAALMGLLEDLTKRVRARWRLLAPAIGCATAIWLLQAVVPSTGIPFIDSVVAWWPAATALTLLLVVGFTQAMNIVDGLNGLASGLAMTMLGVTAVAAYQVDDRAVLTIALVLLAATLGFYLLNFPLGRLFLGDGGAYFLGFVLVELWILLVARNPGEVSPWFVVSVAAHPTIETVFSIIRRRVLRRRPRNATAPDRLHLHTLLLRRRARPAVGRALGHCAPWLPNALGSAVLLCYSTVFMGLAVMHPGSTWWNAFVLSLSTLAYLFWFRRMALFKGRYTSRLLSPRVTSERFAPQNA